MIYPLVNARTETLRLPHLDALRALAVTIVVLFHLKVPGFNVGYLGVDLFFMLSGFLMTWTMLADRQRHGRFRVGAFYVRRFRRITPSLVLTILISIFIAYVIMSPQHLLDTARQAQASILFYSNIFFYNQAGYFAPENEVTALLHTWSLSVEEQFYLLFGFLLLLGNQVRFGLLLAILLGAGLILIATAYATITSPVLAIMPFGSATKADGALFFLLPYRIVQFAAGAACGWATWHNIRPRWRSFPIIAMIAAFGSLVLVSLFPAIEKWSAAVILLPFVGLLFSNPFIDWFGNLTPVRWLSRISYQIYLVHWPLIVFWRYWTFRELGPLEILLVGALSITGGWLLERLVSSTPLGSREIRPFAGAVVLTVIACFGLQSVAIITEGAPFRIPTERQLPTPNQMREMESAYCGGSNRRGDLELGATPDSPLISCERAGGDRHIYVWGDSHARHLLPGVAEVFPDSTVDILYFTSCLPQSGIGNYVYDYKGRKALADACITRNREALSMFEKMPPTTIILHQYAGYGGDNSPTFLDASRLLVNRLEKVGHAVTWIGAVPYPDRLLADCVAVPAIFTASVLEQRCTGSEIAFNTTTVRNAIRADQFPDIYVDITQQFCPDGTYSSCVWMMGDTPLFRDKHHLTVAKSIAIVRAIRDRIKLSNLH